MTRTHDIFRRSALLQRAASTGILALFILFGSQQVRAQNFGDLLITPMRTVFEGANRSQMLTLFNIGGDTATYDISMIQYRMNADGTFTQISAPDSGQQFSDEFVRYFPHSITLAPKEAQNVRVQYRPGANMPDGEFRSHLFFRSVPRKRALADAAGEDTTKLAIRMNAIYGLSIPVIIRKGDLTADVLLKNVTVEPHADSTHTHVMHMTLERTGTMSSYGDITVTLVPAQGEPLRVGIAKGIAVYTPNAARTFTLPIAIPAAVQSRGATLHVEYASHTDLQDKTLAKAVLTLP